MKGLLFGWQYGVLKTYNWNECGSININVYKTYLHPKF